MANKTEKSPKRPAPPPERAKLRPPSSPEIQVGETSLGRGTLADVRDDLRRAPGPRAPMMTVSYNDVPLDAKPAALEKPAGGAPSEPPSPLWREVEAAPAIAPRAPALRRHVDAGPAIEIHEPAPRPRVDSGPAIELRETALGRETLALIELDEEPAILLTNPLPRRTPTPPPSASPSLSSTTIACEALELKSFIVPATALSPHATDEARHAFVRDRLADSLPCSLDRVKRVDARLFEPGAVLVRVFCLVD